MSDMISREDAIATIEDIWHDFAPYEDTVAAIRALPAVQPDAATLLRWHDMLMRDYPADLSSIVCAEMLAMLDEPAVQPAHVNETPKSEHEARDVLTPAVFRGPA